MLCVNSKYFIFQRRKLDVCFIYFCFIYLLHFPTHQLVQTEANLTFASCCFILRPLIWSKNSRGPRSCLLEISPTCQSTGVESNKKGSGGSVTHRKHRGRKEVRRQNSENQLKAKQLSKEKKYFLFLGGENKTVSSLCRPRVQNVLRVKKALYSV